MTTNFTENDYSIFIFIHKFSYIMNLGYFNTSVKWLKCFIKENM